MIWHYGIYYNDQFLFSASYTVSNTASVWHNERLKAVNYAWVKLDVVENDFDNALYKVKKIQPTKDQQIQGLLKGMKASDIELLKEYFKRSQNQGD